MGGAYDEARRRGSGAERPTVCDGCRQNTNVCKHDDEKQATMDEVDRKEVEESSKEMGGERSHGSEADEKSAERSERRLSHGEHVEDLVRNWRQRRRKQKGGEESEGESAVFRTKWIWN